MKFPIGDKFIKNLIEGTFRFFNALIMFIPLSVVRNLWISCVLKEKGKNVFFSRNITICNPRNIYIGNNVMINKKVLLDGRVSKIIIGNNVDIAQEVNIWTLQHDPHSKNHKTISGDVIIDDNVWIASRATILPGCRIHKGAVVACGGIVTKDIPSNAIVGGVPAKQIGQRDISPEFVLVHFPFFE